MTITKQHVKNLLELLSTHGLINGAGNETEKFCVQQAVHRVIYEDLKGQYTDHPPGWCVNGKISSFGINMNDQSHYWLNEKNRAMGLRRFAIAELGSSHIDFDEFIGKLVDKLAVICGGKFSYDPEVDEIISKFKIHRRKGVTPSEWLTKFADAAADTLAELGSEGGQFLWMVDEPDREKRKKEAFALGDKIFANQMSDARSRCSFGSDCSFGLPPRGHHRRPLKADPFGTIKTLKK